MTTGERIKQRRQELGISAEMLAEAVGLWPATIYRYESNQTKGIKADTLLSIAKALKTTVDQLNGIAAPLVPREHASVPPILALYQQLDAHGREVVDAVIRLELHRVRQSMPESCVDLIELRVSEQPAAAGPGVYLGPDAFKTVSVKSTALPKGASFGVPVSGDSMEPRYHDGDILVVAEQPPEPGEIGVFIMDGAGYVKQHGGNCLLSLNPAYAPIPMDDSIRACGKVIGVLSPGDIVS